MWGWLARFLPRSNHSGRLGDRGENLAAEHLVGLGFRIVERQMRGLYGEIDLIALDGETVVFIEVKTRATSAAGDPTEAVTRAKQRKITRAALAYLKRRGWLQRRCRFDVVSILWKGPGGKPEIRHYQSAFDAEGTGQMYS
jgi:putative endonuclease